MDALPQLGGDALQPREGLQVVFGEVQRSARGKRMNEIHGAGFEVVVRDAVVQPQLLEYGTAAQTFQAARGRRAAADAQRLQRRRRKSDCQTRCMPKNATQAHPSDNVFSLSHQWVQHRNSLCRDSKTHGKAAGCWRQF